MTDLPKIIQETEDWAVFSKPAGLVVEKSPYYPSLENYAFEIFQKTKKKPFVGIVHRLDRPVSGVIIIAKKKSVLKKLNELIRFRKIRKTYQTLVENPPPSPQATLTHWMEKDNLNKKAIAHKDRKESRKQAILKYKQEKIVELGYLLEIQLITGRYHQIRAQFAAIGCPIVGDEKYGSTQSFQPNTICLHSSKLVFADPATGQETKVIAPLPDNWLI